MKQFESRFSTSLTDREKMIFSYVYTLKNVEDKKITTYTTYRTVKSSDQGNLRERCRKYGKKFNVDCEVVYEGFEWGFIENSTRYKMVITGLKNDIEMFCGAV